MITLHGYWRSTAAYRVRIALNYKQLAYESVSVHLVKNGGEQHSEEYQLLNPQSLVPTLADNDFVLGQSMAILEYLNEKYPQHNLMPRDINLRATVRQLCQVIAADLHPLNNLRVLGYLSNELKISDDERMNWYHHWLKSGLDAYQKLIRKYNFSGEYTLGRELTMADACLIPQIYNARRFDFSLERYSKLESIEQHCLALDCFNNAIPENQPDAN